MQNFIHIKFLVKVVSSWSLSLLKGNFILDWTSKENVEFCHQFLLAVQRFNNIWRSMIIYLFHVSDASGSVMRKNWRSAALDSRPCYSFHYCMDIRWRAEKVELEDIDIIPRWKSLTFTLFLSHLKHRKCTSCLKMHMHDDCYVEKTLVF